MPISLSAISPDRPRALQEAPRGLRFGDDGRGEVAGSDGDEFTHEHLTRADESPGMRAFMDSYLGTESNPVVLGVFQRVDIDDLKRMVDRHPEDSTFLALELGSRYQNGTRGASADPVLAEYYYEMAATQNDPFGQYYLGLFLMHEKPKPPKRLIYQIWEALTDTRTATQNEIMGYAWLSLAATVHTPRKVGEIQSAELELKEANRWMSGRSRRHAIKIAERWYKGWLAAQTDDA